MTNPDELAPLLVALGRAEIELAAHGDRLRHRPADLPPDLLEGLRRHREAVLALLASEYVPDPAGDAGYVLSERLGVADGLGIPTHAGAAAWLVAVGESISCEVATVVVHSSHGEADGRDSSGDRAERTDAVCDRQGRGGGP